MMNYNKIKLFTLTLTLLNLVSSSCYASDLLEDTIDKSTPAQQLSPVEHQIEELPYVLQLVIPHLKRKELLNCRSISKNIIKTADFILFKSGLTQPIVRIKIRNESSFEQLLSHGLEYTIPNIVIRYNNKITQMHFRRFFNERFSSMRSLKIDWFNLDHVTSQFYPLDYNVIFSLSKALTRPGSIQALYLHS